MPSRRLSKAVTSVWMRDADLEERAREEEAKKRKSSGWRLALLSFSALGVVYGDIGTSPLYTFASIFPNGAPDDENRILGAFSMIFWTLTSVVLVKYILLMLRADDRGEGGIFSLYSIIKRASGIPTLAALAAGDEDLREEDGRKLGRFASGIKRILAKSKLCQLALLTLVLLAVNMIISDGVLTPAISVVSAVGGIQYNTNLSNSGVVGVTIAIIFLLFMIQPFGTQKVSFMFSPVLLLWFSSIASIGIYNIATFRPSVFKGLSPSYIYYFWSGEASLAWHDLGSVMLSITGAEALYADLGHFNARAIQLSFLGLVYPCLTLTYLGQAAYILEHKSAAAQIFWASTPKPVYIPMIILATLAAIIASQALIAGAFSITRTGISMKCFPRFTVRHTSETHEGQIYIPEINFSLMIGCIIIVAVFQNAEKIGNAYGLAIITVMLIDTTLLSLVMLLAWNWPAIVVLAFWLIFTFISAAYWSSNLIKIATGAWFSIALAGILSIITFVYYWGQTRKLEYLRKHMVPLDKIFQQTKNPGHSVRKVKTTLNSLEQVAEEVLFPNLQDLVLNGTHQCVARIPGLGLYYSELVDGVPPVLMRFLRLSPVMHEAVVFLTLRSVPLPRVHHDERLLVRKLEFEGFYQVIARYGYMEDIDQGPDFVKKVVEELIDYLDPEAMEDIIENPYDEDETEQQAKATVESCLVEEGGNVPGQVNLADVHVAGSDGSAAASIRVDLDPSISLNSAEGKRLLSSSIEASSKDKSLEIEERHSPEVSINTAAGRQLLTQIQSRLRINPQDDKVGNDQDDLDKLDSAKHETADAFLPQSRGPRLTVSMSYDDGPRSKEHIQLPGTVEGSGRLSSRPWVRQPSVIKRVRTLGVYRMSQVKDTSASVPLPLPPSRPPLYLASEIYTEHSLPVGTKRRFFQRGNVAGSDYSPSDTLMGKSAAELAQQLQEYKKFIEQQHELDKFSKERSLLLTAYGHGVVHLLARSELRAAKHSKKQNFGQWIKSFIVDVVYHFLVVNTRPASADYQLPSDTLLEVSTIYEI